MANMCDPTSTPPLAGHEVGQRLSPAIRSTLPRPLRSGDGHSDRTEGHPTALVLSRASARVLWQGASASLNSQARGAFTIIANVATS